MINFIKNSFLIGLLMIGLVSGAMAKLPINNSTLSINQELSYEEKIKLLTEKMKLADFSFRAIDDPKFIKALTSEVVRTSENEKCVFERINREKFNRDFDEGVEVLVKENPQYVDLYLSKLDLLISISNTFYNHPTAIEFDKEDLSNSPALSILSKEDSVEFQSIILDERYHDLMYRIGQPAKVDDVIFDFSVIKFFILGAFVYESERQCNLRD